MLGGSYSGCGGASRRCTARRFEVMDIEYRVNPSRFRLHRSIGILLTLFMALASAPTRAEAPAFTVRLPMAMRRSPYVNPFGFNTLGRITDTMKLRASDLNVRWVRLMGFNWRQVQPNAGDAYDWPRLSSLESKLRDARALGLTPIVVVQDSPHWATVIPSSCAAVKPDAYDEFAAFMEAAVERYGGGEFGVQYWELGNEVDFAADQVRADSVFGCWGDPDDPYYGGRAYGEMLKVVTPAMRRANADVQVMLGGLAVEDPNPPKSKFLAGILEAGAASYFDIVAYHGHAMYYGRPFLDNTPGNAWRPYGTGGDAKANFIRQILVDYGVDKPLFFDEASYICPVNEAPANCTRPSDAFFDEQANFVVRGYVSTLSAGVQALMWYTLEDSGWHSSGLLDSVQAPRPVYHAFQTLIERTAGAALPPVAVDEYGPGVRAYRFRNDAYFTDVVYAAFVGTINVGTGEAPEFVDYPDKYAVSWPKYTHVALYDRFGVPLQPGMSNDRLTFDVSKDPVYIVRRP